MTVIIISLLLLVSLLPLLTFTAHVGIVNGMEVTPHSRPYMVSVQLYGKHICGGFLIDRQFVLTAAHCSNKLLSVVVGVHKLSQSKSSDRYGVVSNIPHPDFKLSPVQNDIMLLKLSKKVNLSKNVSLISLPNDGEDVKERSYCTVVGWGSDKIKGSMSDLLMEADTITINNAECKRRWGSVYMTSQMICSHGYGGICDGDSGGPLVCGETAVGVTSYSDKDVCNSKLHPNVYMKISKYLQWIRKEMRKYK